MIRGESRGERVVMTSQPRNPRESLALRKKVLQYSVHSARSFASPPKSQTGNLTWNSESSFKIMPACAILLLEYMSHVQHEQVLILMVNREQWTHNMFSEIVLLVIVMLVTSLCWWLYDSDWFHMLVAESLCWRLFRYVGGLKSLTNILNRSTTHLVSNIRHQHRFNLF